MMETSETEFVMAEHHVVTNVTSASPLPPHDLPTSIQTSSISQRDGSVSDVSMSTDSGNEDEEEFDTSADGKPTHIVAGSVLASYMSPDMPKKRKHSDSIPDLPRGDSFATDLEVRKRLKPDPESQGLRIPDGHLLQDRSLLPAEIWQCIFTYTPPRTLGSLLCVNKVFNAYLDYLSDKSFSVLFTSSAAQITKPEAVWKASRRLFRPQMPHPLANRTELDMWRLGCCASCQFCGKKRPQSTSQVDPWHPGPGEDGVSSIWAFAVRSCGACLQQRTMKEIDLLLSSSIPSPLMAALPFVFLTNELHVIPSNTLQSGQQPSTIQIGKRFFQPHVDAIKAEFVEVKSMGSATAEEWLKGLDGRGKQRRSDAARWERFEAMGGASRMLYPEPSEIPQVSLGSKTITVAPAESTSFARAPSNLPAKPMPASLPRIPPLVQTGPPLAANAPLPQRFNSPANFGASRTFSVSRPERTKEEVAELKAARRAEIERRAMILIPPLSAEVLAHMSSYQAAVQIIQPLDDHAWEVLKPRLISQRYEAERRERERVAQNRVVEEQLDERRLLEMQTRSDSRDLLDSQWDDLQAPLRARIGGYADEIIHNSWTDGKSVNKGNASKFAADVLIYVRKRFYAEMAKDEAAIRATGLQPERDPVNGPYTRKLVLENMKWVFDTKVKPHTELYSKELFLCSICGNNFKYYGFEGVIQHYAAKHTASLSIGSVVVHWKAEWPEDPPFHPDPTALGGNTQYHHAGPNGNVSYPTPQPAQQFSFGGYQASAPAPAPVQMTNPHTYQESPAPYYGPGSYGAQYGPPQNGPFPPHQTYQEPPQDYQPYSGQSYSNGPQHMPTNGYQDTSQNYPQQGYNGSYPATSQGTYPAHFARPSYSTPIPDQSTQQHSYMPQGAPYVSTYKQPPVYPAPAPAQQITQPIQRSEDYMTQLQDLAKNARETWNSISTVKDIPGSVKVFTIIYHILKRSREAFQNDPPLSMLMEGLSNNKDMRPVRNVNGLVCRACTLSMPGTPARQDKKYFSFPQLVNHFYSAHEQDVIQNNLGPIPDWTKDMVELPDKTRLLQIPQAAGMGNQKLMLYAEALPEILDSEPKMEESEANPIYGDSRGPYVELPPSHDDHAKYYATVDGNANATYNQTGHAPYNGSGNQNGFSQATYLPMHRDQAVNDDRRASMRSDFRPISPHLQIRPNEHGGHYVVREEAPAYIERYPQYQETTVGDYHQSDMVASGAGANRAPARSLATAESYYSKVPPSSSATPANIQGASNMHRLNDAIASQNNRLSDIVAQISQHAQQAQGRHAVKKEPVDGGSEDGELLGDLTDPRFERVPTSDEASNAAERFLNSFLSGDHDDPHKVGAPARSAESNIPSRRNTAHGDNLRRVYEQSPPQVRVRESHDLDRRLVDETGRLIYAGEQPPRGSYVIHERPSNSTRPYAYEERYVPASEPIPRDRSPILVDQRFKVNNVIYREDRQASTVRRTPGRYARYESVRVENEREHSRSPVYVRYGSQGQQYIERSPVGPPDPHYQTAISVQPGASPQEEMQYERERPREVYRVYTEEQRRRPQQPAQYAEAYEYVQMSDAQGDYVIRRPVRREPEPVYAYEREGGYARPMAGCETRPSVAMAGSGQRGNGSMLPGLGASGAAAAGGDDEEYDPRHPAPMPAMDGVVRRY